MTEVTQKQPPALAFTILLGFGLLAFAGVLVGTSSSEDFQAELQAGLRGSQNSLRRLQWWNETVNNFTLSNMSESSSSGPSASLTSFDSSLKSFNSMDSLSSGSLEKHMKSGLMTYYGMGGSGQWLVNITIMLIYAAIYKTKVVDKITPMVHQPPTGKDQFEFGLCDCLTDPQVCCLVIFCPLVRIAHTNQVSGVCDYWETFCCMAICSCFVVGPCCLNVYFRMHLKDNMGIQDHCFEDLCVTFFCFNCSVGQQGMSIDRKLGYDVKCCCDLQWTGMGGMGNEARDYGGERSGLMTPY